MSARDRELRKQAEAVCVRRTMERDEARAIVSRMTPHAELGRAVSELAEQIERLRNTRGLPFGLDVESIAAKAIEEVYEVMAEEPGSLAARSESADMLAVAVHMVITQGLPPLEAFDMVARKIRGRLDTMDRGATWDAAKADEP